MLVWLCVWVKVQICMWSGWCHCHSLSLAPGNPDCFYLPNFTFLVPAYPGNPGLSPEGHKMCVCACVCACVHACMHACVRNFWAFYFCNIILLSILYYFTKNGIYYADKLLLFSTCACVFVIAVLANGSISAEQIDTVAAGRCFIVQ